MPRANYDEHLAAMRDYAKTPQGKAARARATLNYRQRRKDRVAAHNAVSKAILRGKLKRQPCEVCGNAESEAHHPDYTKRLDVQWLCDTHHKAAHRAMKQASKRLKEERTPS